MILVYHCPMPATMILSWWCFQLQISLFFTARFHDPIWRHQGEVGEDPTATCEPFFVPRQPVFWGWGGFFTGVGISRLKKWMEEELYSKISSKKCVLEVFAIILIILIWCMTRNLLTFYWISCPTVSPDFCTSKKTSRCFLHTPAFHLSTNIDSTLVRVIGVCVCVCVDVAIGCVSYF